MMRTYQGMGVCSGIAAGRILLLRREASEVKQIFGADAWRERERFEHAKALAAEQLGEIYDKALREAGEAGAAVFQAHRMLLEDEDYNRLVYSMLEDRRVNAEYAVAAAADSFAEMLSALEDGYMKARAADVRDVSERLVRNLSGKTPWEAPFGESVILCAEDLTPSETAGLDRDKVLAFVTAGGSSDSHAAILARGMNIPAVVGAGDGFLSEIRDGEEAVVDGGTGELFVNPDGETRARLLEKRRRQEEKKRLLRELKGKENVTLDGRKINVYANIGSPGDIAGALENDAEGIGLFRSEFLYLERDCFPTEEEQLAAYREVLQGMGGRKVIIRTLDIGADKTADYFELKKEGNPALGCRGIRVCLKRPELFKTQLRALYRASAFGRLGIMFPMLTSVSELEKILEICAGVREELKGQGMEYSGDVELGIMIETPAAAVISDRLAPMVDFFSVGSNDLTQYTLACDRQNPEVREFADTHHEAVLRLIEMSVENAHRHGAWVGICGELGADTTLTERLLRMGIDEISVAPPFVLEVRDAVRKIDLSQPGSEAGTEGKR